MVSTRPLLPPSASNDEELAAAAPPPCPADPPSQRLRFLLHSPPFQALLLLQLLLLAAHLTYLSPRLLALGQPPYKFDQAVYMSECLHPMGGGLVRPGGGFKALNDSVISDECAEELRTYFSKQEGQYWVDVARVAEAARQYFDALSLVDPPSVHKLIVFDIDETALSNAEEWQRRLQRRLQRRAGRGSEGGGVAAAGVALGKAVAGEDDSPPLAPMLALYQYLFSAGYSVAFITGRKESSRNNTETNLAKAGYGQRCHKEDLSASGALALGTEGSGAVGPEGPSRRPTRGCYVELHMRELDDDRLASVYKPARRAELEAQGYTVYGNFGDQFSDLDGTRSAPHSFKLPNPSYLIL